LERVRYENQGIVPACCASMAGRVLAKSFLARLAGVYIQTFIVRIKKAKKDDARFISPWFAIGPSSKHSLSHLSSMIDA
jgi:hypothetical protein